MGTPGPALCPAPDKKDQSDVSTKPGEAARGGGQSRVDAMKRGARCASDFDESEAPFRFTRPKDAGKSAREPRGRGDSRDPSDPRACVDGAEMTSAPLTETPSHERPAREHERMANDAALNAKGRLTEAARQRVSAFTAAAAYLQDAAKEVNDKSTIVSLMEKAFNVASASLIGLGAAKIASQLLRSIVSQSLSSTMSAVANTAASSGDKVSFAAFQASEAQLQAAASLAFEQGWYHENVRDQLLASPYPEQECAGLVAGTNAVVGQAYRTQYASTLSAWLGAVDAAKKDESENAVEIRVEFFPGGGFVIKGCKVTGAMKSVQGALRQPATPGGAGTPLTLRELMVAGGGARVRIVDQSQAVYEWSAASQAITTPDSVLMHHRVGAWGHAKVGAGVAPIVGAHRFLFEELGPKSFTDLGLGQ